MKRTAYMTALALAGAVWWAPVSAEETLPASEPASLSVLSEELDTAASVGVVGDIPAGFLPAMDLGGHMSYHPVDFSEIAPDTAGAPMMLGQLRIERDGILETADVVNLELSSPDLDQALRGLFPAGGPPLPAEGVQKMALFNRMLGNAGAMVNEAILEGIASARRETGEPMPYSIFHVELRSTEPLHCMDGMDGALVYTAGSRVLFYVDGWIFPQYVKAYLWKDGGAYRLIAVCANDSQKDSVREAADRLVKAACGGK